MKKYIFLFAILLASCDAPVDEPKGSGAWAEETLKKLLLLVQMK